MKREILLATMVIACLFLVRTVMGQSILTPVSVDENGNGYILPTAGAFTAIPFFNAPDPLDPANGLLPLIYNLGAVGLNNPVTGDLVLTETSPSPANAVSDVVRFESVGTNSFLVFYSDKDRDAATALADVGLPPTSLANQFVVQEQGSEDGWNGYNGYFPTTNQPGYIPGVIYNITSDVPEPTSLALLAVGALGFMIRPVRRSSK
ncbi:MAG: PEP-CTERM sorting domain-containing protein [Tepidisphaeraceae bacterium]|jgi:hypothetical protein